MSEGTHAIDICICTYRRPQVVETLASLARLKTKSDWKLRVIVADNDDNPSAKDIVEQAARDIKLDLTYTHAPARNISVARNACLDAATAPYFAFLDDDEQATENWLIELMTEIERSNADVILGPVRARYDAKVAPDWMQKGDFHATRPVFVNGEIITGYSCNVLFNADSPALKGLRFRPDLGKTGGEDTFFFAQIHQNGGKIAFAPEAWVEEDVPPARAKLGWLIKRRFRFGQTHGLLLLEQNAGLPARLKNSALAAAKSSYSLLGTIFNLAQKDRAAFWLLRSAMHAGVVCRLLGKKELEQYGKDTVQ